MRLNALPLLYLLLLTCSTLQAQLKKGDFLVSPSLNMDYNFKGTNSAREFTQGLQAKGYRMISKRIMLGGEIEVDNNDIQSNDFGYYIGSSPYFSYQITGEMRAYFSTGKWAPFAYLNGTYSRINYFSRIFYDPNTGEEVVNLVSPDLKNGTLRAADLGFGLTIFLSENVVFEPRVGWNLHRKANNFLDLSDRELYVDSGFTLLFRKGDNSAVAPLKDRYLKAGNLFLNGHLSYHKPIPNEDKIHEASMQVESRFFVLDRMEAIAKLGFDFRREKFLARIGELKDRTSSINGTAGLRYYIPISNNLFLAPSARVDILSHRENNTENIEDEFRIPISLDLVYFKNQSRYYLGTTYERYTISDPVNDNKIQLHSNDIYIGIEYFFHSHIYLRSQLTNVLSTDFVYRDTDLPKLKDNLRKMNLSFTFGFMIGN